MKARFFLYRTYLNDCTRGRLTFAIMSLPADIRALLSDFSCYVLELPWRDNKRSISCIPEGLYPLVPHDTERFPEHVGIANVTGRSGVLFHVGNTVNDSRGCPLLGESRFSDCEIRDSGEAVTAFNNLFYELHELGVTCELKIYSNSKTDLR